MNKLNRFYLSQNISVDNALSMNQILHQIVNQIKEIVDFINNLELRANEYTDQEILKLKNNLESQLATLEQTLKTYTDNSIDTYNAEIINPQLNEIRNTIDNVNTLLNNRIDNEVGILNRKIDSVESSLIVMINETKEYLEELIKKGNQLVYSAISGKKIPIQDTLFEMGNALKQILSYNWNSINTFKRMVVIPSGVNVINNDFGVSDIATPQVTNLDIENEVLHFDRYLTSDVYSNVSNIIINDVDSEISFEVDVSTHYIPVSFFTEFINTVKITYNSPGGFTTENLFKIYNFEFAESHIISFNSLKLAMQELDVNWNALIYTGVNTFYELNELEMLYDTEGVKSSYFIDDKYKVIHNNFESDFFKSNVN